MIRVTYPHMREELVDYLVGLSDLDYQRRVWIDAGSQKTVVYDNFDLAVHFLFDDTALASDPYSTIGKILQDASEARAIAVLKSCLDDLFNQYGLTLSDAEYIALPEWRTVIAAAEAALVAMSER